MHIHIYKMYIHKVYTILKSKHLNFTMILPVQAQKYRVFNILSSILYLRH